MSLSNTAAAQLRFERSLTLGMEVYAHWTNHWRTYHMQGTLVKINAKSYVVRLAEAIVTSTGQVVYVKGQHITVPKYVGLHSSTSNRLTPLPDEPALPATAEEPNRIRRGCRTPDAVPIITPIIHLNGDRYETLILQLETAYAAVRRALDAVRETAPNGRNYYPEPGRLQKAEDQYQHRLTALKDVLASLEAESIQLQREQEEPIR